MLTPEEMERIRAEEAKRLAEEQYRAQVRKEMDSPAAAEPGRASWTGGTVAVVGVVIVALVITVVILQRRNSTGPSIPAVPTQAPAQPAADPTPIPKQAVAAAAAVIDKPATDDPALAPQPPVPAGMCKPAPWAAAIPCEDLQKAANPPTWVHHTNKILEGSTVVRHQSTLMWTIVVADTNLQRDFHLYGKFIASGGARNDVEAIVTTEVDYLNWINGHQAQSYWSTAGKETTGEFDLRLGPGRYVLAFNNKFSLLTDKVIAGNIYAEYESPQ